MGNAVGSLFSGIGRTVGDLVGHPLDFLTGKSCSTVCKPTWDVICYIENFCVANLMKLALALVMLYIVLLFLYLLYQVGICNCVAHCLCRAVWVCCTTYFSALKYICTFCCVHLLRPENRNRTRRRHMVRDIEDSHYYSNEEEDSGDSVNDRYSSENYKLNAIEGSTRPTLDHRHRRHRAHRKSHIRRSLRPRSHRIRVKVSRGSVDDMMNNRSLRKRRNEYYDHGISRGHDIRVLRSSKFVHKGSFNKKHRR